MPCNELPCRLNDELLAILPWLETEQQQRILQHWRELDLAGRDALLRSLREPRVAELDLATLSRLADYFQCGVYDVMRYLRGRR
jgi:hypothetical protein